MKKLFTICILGASLFLGTGSMVEARPPCKKYRTTTYLQGYDFYGRPIYIQRIFIGYNRWGKPIWEERRIYNNCRPNRQNNNCGNRHHHRRHH